MSKKLVIYHGDCADGFCAAWMAWRKFGTAAEYLPAYHGQPPPDVRGKSVYIVDFSYSYESTLRMIEEAADLVILDHHKTAEEDLMRIDLGAYAPGQVHISFDMSRSGAGIARDFFQPGLKCWLVDYTQDRDLWRFQLPMSKRVNAYIGTLEQTFDAYEFTHLNMTEAVAAKLGEGAEAYQRMYVAKMVPHARRRAFAGHENIPVINAPFVGISELVGELAESALFAVGWFQRGDGKFVCSLRSRGDFDVSKVAKRFGGGGHRNAAGFQLDSIEALTNA